MVAEVVDARWATTPIDVTFVGVEANVDTSVGQNNVIGVIGLWSGAEGDVRFGKFKPCEVFGSADQNATGWVFDPEIRNGSHQQVSKNGQGRYGNIAHDFGGFALYPS